VSSLSIVIARHSAGVAGTDDRGRDGIAAARPVRSARARAYSLFSRPARTTPRQREQRRVRPPARRRRPRAVADAPRRSGNRGRRDGSSNGHFAPPAMGRRRRGSPNRCFATAIPSAAGHAPNSTAIPSRCRPDHKRSLARRNRRCASFSSVASAASAVNFNSRSAASPRARSGMVRLTECPQRVVLQALSTFAGYTGRDCQSPQIPESSASGTLARGPAQVRDDGG
jgi:hypothetical protein